MTWQRRPQAILPSGLVQETAWVPPEVSEAITEWGEAFEKIHGIEFRYRSDVLRAFYAIYLGQLRHSVGEPAAEPKPALRRKRH